jgi:AraC-like DNA-binding protein
MVTNPAPFPAVHDSVEMPRLLLAVADAGGADADQLARDAQVPGHALACDGAMIPSHYVYHLWELVEHALENPHVPLTTVARHKVGDLDLFDYLLTTAATLKDGLRVNGDFLHLVTTNGRLQIEAETDRDTTYSCRTAEPGGRGAELWVQFTVAGFCARAQAATRRPVVPAHVAFAQPPPRSHRAFIETLGTSRIDFGAPVTTFTFRACDLDLAVPGADPALARILTRYAATLAPRPLPTWHEHFQQQLAEAIDHGNPTLDTLAHRLALSTRTLQRQLAERGTTWRAELDAARQRRAQHARQADAANMADLARQLGYSDPRSARRALRRWNDRTGGTGRGQSEPW